MIEDIGQLIRGLRGERNLSLRVLAQQAGIGRSTLSDWEAGKAKPRVSELESVLAVLNVSPGQRRQALSDLGGSRAIQLLAKEGDRPPVTGDLLRAMRLRRGLTQEEAARRSGVSQGMIAKWECSEDRPSEAHLHALCWTLNAHPEELTALLRGRFGSAPPTPEKFDREWLRERYRDLVILGRGDDTHDLMDLAHLSFEAELREMARRDAAANDGVAYIQSVYSIQLYNNGRYSEARKRSDDALRTGGQRWECQFWWLDALMVRVMLMSKEGGSQAKSAVALAHSAMGRVQDVQYRSWLYGEIGYALTKLGEHQAAFRATQKAVGEAENSGYGHEVRNRRTDSLNVLTASGDMKRISDYLAQYGGEITSRFSDDPDTTQIVAVIRALLAVGDIAGAEQERSRLDTRLEELHATHKRPNWESVFAQVSVGNV